MNDFILVVADYLKGKSIYAPFRRALNLLFNISIASYFFEKIYGVYYWFDFNDYKRILDFFIKGEFFIPLSLFIAVYGVSQFLSVIVFNALNQFKVVRWTKSIMSYQVNKEFIDKSIEGVDEVAKYLSPVKINKETIIKIYPFIKRSLKPERIEEELKEPKRNLEANYHLAFRATLAITVYFISLPHYGWLLYVLTLIVLFFGMYLILLGHRLCEVLPSAIRKFQTESEKYLNEFQTE